MVDLFSNPDGADGQSQAVLAYLRYHHHRPAPRQRTGANA